MNFNFETVRVRGRLFVACLRVTAVVEAISKAGE